MKWWKAWRMRRLYKQANRLINKISALHEMDLPKAPHSLMISTAEFRIVITANPYSPKAPMKGIELGRGATIPWDGTAPIVS